MVYKIIKTDDYLLVLGKNYKSDSFPYTVAEKLTTGDYQLWQVDNPNDVDEPNQFEILAHLPLNGSPVLEGVPLLPSGRELIFETIGGSYGLESIDEHDQVDGYFDTYKEAELALFKNITDFECEMSKDCYYIPKTITTAQGVQWVGKYK